MSTLEHIQANSETVLALFQAIKADWAVCDDSDEDTFMVLISEDRDVDSTLKPSKTLVELLDDDGFIELDVSRSSKKGAPREFEDWFDGPEPVPFVYMYKLTAKGHELMVELKSTKASE